MLNMCLITQLWISYNIILKIYVTFKNHVIWLSFFLLFCWKIYCSMEKIPSIEDQVSWSSKTQFKAICNYQNITKMVGFHLKTCSFHSFFFLSSNYLWIWRRKWQPTPVFLPGESHGWRSLVGYSPWGR